jgi:hypothetical protein
MSIITKMRKQTAVYWEPLGTRDEFGNNLFSDPVEIDCRWEDDVKQFVGRDGETYLSASIVYVDRDVEVGGVLLLGAIDSSMDAEEPLSRVGASEIKQFAKLPNLKNTEYLRTAYL